MADGVKVCPECRAALEPGYRGGLGTWQCPNDHGVGIHLLEAYRHLQRDELEAIWAGTKTAPRSHLLSPITGVPMVEVTFTVDDDDVYGNEGRNARDMVIEVDVDNYFGWFSLDELRSMPSDDAGRGPAAPGLVGLSQMQRGAEPHDAFFENLDEADFDDHPRGMNGLLGGLARRLRR